MGVEAGHIQITEFTKETIPYINWMMEDLFCRYGVAMPYFLLDFSFPDYAQRPDWVVYSPPDWYPPEWKAYWPTWIGAWWPDWLPTNGFAFGSYWGEWGHWLFWFNELLGLLFDRADLPRWQMPDFSPSSIAMLNERISFLYENVPEGEDIELSPEAGDNRIRRGTTYYYTYNEAKDAYENNPTHTISEGSRYITWYLDHPIGEYRVLAWQSYANFDTTNIASFDSASLVLSIEDDGVGLVNTSEDPVVYCYKHDYNTLEGEDWIGGEKIAERTFTIADNSTTVEIDIPNSSISLGDYSRYRFGLKKMIDLEYWPANGTITIEQAVEFDSIKLKLYGAIYT